ncbi:MULTISPECIES: PstS family phosphate ABC transporter substrate-binding protein [Roseomonadaceae]|uniref:Substrate-binding domain-containing protein n=1 Tax=Falsiroseomonas oleicola TaxID=2801474 RepID=A0ABS6H3D2_9PROT|nr:substrate-binding domain-containing protein [Roseomonas oleicola]MBU8543166.1 substrate-binding domain-containing protein [Roseomonas oleicola]
MGHLRSLFLGLAMAVGAAAPALAQGAMRDRLVVISSTSAGTVARMIGASFAERYEGALEPTRRGLPTTAALELFCAGIGPQTPDIAITVRRMPRTMLETCQGHGVREVVEMRLGLSAVLLAVRRGEPTPNLTSRQVWEALAAERIDDEEFVPNRRAMWSDVAPSLPRTEIHVLAPNLGTGTNGLFEDMVLEGGCRDVKAIRLLFEAAYRRGKCITARDDGRIQRMGGLEVPAALLAAPPGTIGVISFDQLLASGGNLVALSLDGVLPTQASIYAQDYVATRTVYLYAKRQHTRMQEGVGVVRGIREFLNEAASEAASGPGGYLSVTGLVPLGPGERAAQRRTAERLTLISR